jgi:hypothetical protein
MPRPYLPIKAGRAFGIISTHSSKLKGFAMNTKRNLVVNTPGSYSIFPSDMSETVADMHESVKSMQSAIDIRNANKPTVKMGKTVVERPTVKMVRLIHPGRV